MRTPWPRLSVFLPASLALALAVSASGCDTAPSPGSTDAALDGAATTPDAPGSADTGVGGMSDASAGGLTGTCVGTCGLTLAPHCPLTPFDMAMCVASCTLEQTRCQAAGMAVTYQAYLDCVQNHPVTCSATGRPASPMCISQGLDILGCAGSPGDAGTHDAGH